MSIRVTDIKQPTGSVGAPGEVPGFMLNYVNEGPPFYETVTIRRWGSGTRSSNDGYGNVMTHTYDYDVTEAFTRSPRQELYTINGGAQIFNAPWSLGAPLSATRNEIFGITPTEWLNWINSHPNNFVMSMQKPFYYPRESDYYLGRHYAIFELSKSVTGDFLTIDYTSESNPEENFTTTSGTLPFMPVKFNFSGSLPNGGGTADFSLMDVIFLSDISIIDADVYDYFTYPTSSITNWRDLRGEYTATVDTSGASGWWDEGSNSVVHHISVTLA